jgi:hypothetical protein
MAPAVQIQQALTEIQVIYLSLQHHQLGMLSAGEHKHIHVVA